MIVALILVSALLLTSCAALLGPREVELPVAQLQEAMARKFPFNNRYLELFDINITNPRLALQPESNRVVTTFDTSIAPPFLKQAWTGSLTLSGNLRLDAARNAVMLGDPRVENFALSGAGNQYQRQISAIASLFAEQLFANVPLYTFDPSQLQVGGTNFLPTKINTRSDALVVTFEPAR